MNFEEKTLNFDKNNNFTNKISAIKIVEKNFRQINISKEKYLQEKF